MSVSMPCTRGGGRHDLAEGLMDSDDDYDPDYRETDSEDDELPRSMQRDRAQWIVDNQDALEDLYRNFKETGQSCFGRAFFQTGNITSFANFLYRFTTPGADFDLVETPSNSEL